MLRSESPRTVRGTIFGASATTLALAAAAVLPAPSRGQMFVPNAGPGSVTVHPVGADGDAPPMRRLQGPATGLSTPFAVVVDRENRELFVSSFLSNSVLVFDLDANGDAAPKREIAGPATELAAPIGLALDPLRDELFVREFGGSEIHVYARDADGDVAPLRTLGGPNTGIDGNAVDLAVDLEHDELLVTSRVFNSPPECSIRVFARTAFGDAAPLRVIVGANTGLADVYGIALDLVHDEIVVATTGAVRTFARVATGNATPLRSISGPSTGLAPTGIALDLERDEIVVAQQNGVLRVFARTAVGDVAPLRVVQGAQTGLDGSTLLDLVPQLFADGFQGGDSSAWSATVP